jgi:hypothetical protein
MLFPSIVRSCLGYKAITSDHGHTTRKPVLAYISISSISIYTYVTRLYQQIILVAMAELPLMYKDYTVGWICAPEVEQAAARASLDLEHRLT